MRKVAPSAARLALLAVAATGLVHCKGADGGQIAAAAITLGAAVAAAAINRAATDECWGNCPPGTYCDEASGLCILPDENGSASPSDDDVEWVECDRAQFECGTNQWLRCESRCEWVMCGKEETAPNAAEPERCCHQPCAWVDCFEDGRPCEAARIVPRRLSATPTDPGPRDPCRGLCAPTERCEVLDGIADCIALTP